MTGEIYDLNTDATGGAYPVAAAVGTDGLGYNLPAGTPITFFGLFPSYTPTGDPFKGGWDNLGKTERRVYNLTGNVSYDIGNVTLTSITNYNSVKTKYFEDNDNTPRPWLTFFQDSRTKTFSEELRANTKLGSSDLTLGAYYLNIDGAYQQEYLADFSGMVGGMVFPQADYSLKTESFSAFAQLEQPVTEKLKLTGGVRYTTDRKNYSYLQSCTPSLGVCQALGLDAPGSIGEYTMTNGSLKDKHREGGVSARVQADYQANPDWLLYASFNLGYKAFNYNAGFAGNAPLAKFRYSGEHLYAYEAGSKLSFLNGAGRFNVSAYYYDYKDYQAFDQRGVNFTLFNTDATIYGGEADISLRPGAGFTVAAGMSLLHTEVKDVPIASELLSRKASQSPEFTLNGLIRKEFNFDWGQISAQMDATYTDGYFAQLSNAPNTSIPSNWLTNARIAYRTSDEKYEIAVYAKNLLDKTRYTYSYDVSLFGFTKYNVAPPRIIGVELRTEF